METALLYPTAAVCSGSLSLYLPSASVWKFFTNLTARDKDKILFLDAEWASCTHSYVSQALDSPSHDITPICAFRLAYTRWSCFHRHLRKACAQVLFSGFLLQHCSIANWNSRKVPKKKKVALGTQNSNFREGIWRQTSPYMNEKKKSRLLALTPFCSFMPDQNHDLNGCVPLKTVSCCSSNPVHFWFHKTIRSKLHKYLQGCIGL